MNLSRKPSKETQCSAEVTLTCAGLDVLQTLPSGLQSFTNYLIVKDAHVQGVGWVASPYVYTRCADQLNETHVI